MPSRVRAGQNARPGKKIPKLWGCAFFDLAQSRAVSRENAHLYDGSASGELYLDTPRQITDTAGNVVWDWANLDPFGANMPNENPSGQGTFKFDLRFTNMVSDAETQTFYNFYRDCYDPTSGRYCQSDPVGLYGASFSTYAYVNSNPLSYVDPLGLGPTSRAPPPRGSVANEYYNSLLSQIRELRPEYRPPSSIGNRDSDVSDAEIAILRNELANLRRPPNQCTADMGRSGAFNEAKRQSDIPTSQQPSRVTPNLDRRGDVQPGRTYEFEIPAPGGGTTTVTIRDDAAGHNYGPGNEQNRGPHFNDGSGNHYDY